MTMIRYDRGKLWRRQVQERAFNAGRRYWLDDDEDAATAPHEAGHVIAGWSLNLKPTYATIVAGHGFAGYANFANNKATEKTTFAHAVALMAGTEAEILAGGSDDRGHDDLTKARRLVGSFCRTDAEVDVLIECARASARDLLKANMGPWFALTVALLAKRSLDADEIAEVMHANEDGGDMWTRVLADQRQIHHGAPEPIPRPLDRGAVNPVDPQVRHILRRMQARARALSDDDGPIFENGWMPERGHLQFRVGSIV